MAVILCDALHWQIFLQIQLQEETLEKDQAGLVNTRLTSAIPLHLFFARTTNSSIAGEKACYLEQQSLLYRYSGYVLPK